MLRTLNFTGRKRITRDCAQITLQRDHLGNVSFTAQLNFSKVEASADSQVFIEAYFKAASERFCWGTIGNIQPPTDRRLRRLAQPELALFRVKVVEAVKAGPGRLLAVADHIAPEGLGPAKKGRVSLLRVNPTDALREEIWQLDLSSDGGPILDLNRGVPGIKERAREEAFMALVFPTVLRQIFQRIFEDGIDDPQNDPDSWQAGWLRFGKQFSGSFPPSLSGEEPGEEHSEWIDEVVGGWSQKMKIIPNFKRAFANKEGEGK